MAYGVHASNTGSSTIQGINVKNVTTAGVKLDYGNTVNLTDVMVSQYVNGVFTTVPTTAGIWADHFNNLTYINPRPENLPAAAGLKFTSASVVKVIGGTSEGNKYAMTADAASSDIELDHMDNEANITRGVSSAARGTIINGGIYSGLTSPSDDIDFLSGCLHCTVTNEVLVNGITVAAGAESVVLENSTFGQNGGTITDSGTGTTIFNMKDQNGGAQFSNKQAAYPGAYNIGNGTATAGVRINAELSEIKPANVAVETGASANNAIVATLTINGVSITPGDGQIIWIKLTHTLQAGANTLTINGVSNPVFARSTGGNLTVAVLASGLWYPFQYTAGIGYVVFLQ